MGNQVDSRSTSGTASALGHLRVLDLAGNDGQYCGKLFADLGADVIKIEPPGGDPARYMAPFAEDSQGDEHSLRFLNFNTNKRSMMLDLTSDQGQDTLRRLVSTADVLIETFTPGYLDNAGLGYDSLSAVNPALVMASITPFGQTGPNKELQGSDLIAQAMGGLMYLQGDDAKPPCAAPCDQASQLASAHAAYGTLTALHHRNLTGEGQHVDVSMQEVVAHLLFSIPQYALNSQIIRRTGATSTIAPNGYYECKDGRASLAIFFPHHWQVMVDWMDIDALADPMWQDMDFRRTNPDIVDLFVAEFASGFTVEEFVSEAQKRHLAASSMNTVAGFVNDRHMKTRDYLVTVDHPDLGKHSYPGAPYILSKTPWRVQRPAPRLGEHNQEVLADLVEAVPSDRIVRDRTTRDASELPLSGVRIVDFTRVWAGPFATRYLADLGAEVIKIETNQFLDNGRLNPNVSPMFPDINRSKLGVTINFRDPQGAELLRELVATSDVVVENFAAGVLERRGLGYEDLRLVKPDIVMISMPGYGNEGPHSQYVAYGQNLMAYAGLSMLWGFPDSPLDARPSVHYSDFVSAAHGATAIMAALEHRSRTGEGQFIEIPQSETLASTMGVALLDYLTNGRSWQPVGNRSMYAAPPGCYPCRGDDQWCAVACFTDDHWNAVCRAMGEPDWAQADAFNTLEHRLQNQDELDKRIGQWTSDYTPHQVMRMLQQQGVPAGVVQSGEQLYYDHHMRSREFIVAVEHSGSATLEHTGLTVRLSKTPGRIVRGLPELGQHNKQVFSDLLGSTPDQLASMIESKVIN